MLLILEAENRASPKINEAKRDILEYAAAVDAAAADVAAASARMDEGMATAAGKTDDLQHAQHHLDDTIREGKSTRDGSEFVRMGEHLAHTRDGVEHLSGSIIDLDKLQAEMGVAAEEAATHVGHSSKAVNENRDALSMLRRWLADAQQGFRDTRDAAAEFEKGVADASTATKGAETALHGAHRASRDFLSGLKDVSAEQRFVFDEMGRLDGLGSRIRSGLVEPFRAARTAARDFSTGLRGAATGTRDFGRVAGEASSGARRLGVVLGTVLRPALVGLQGAFAPAIAGTQQIGNLVGSLGPVVSGTGLRIAGMGLGIASLAGPVAGLAGLAVPALFSAIGMGAEGMRMNIQRAMMSGQQLTATQQMMLPVVNTLTAAFAGLHGPLMAAAQGVANTVVALGPQFHAAVAALAPMVTAAGAGISDLTRNIVAGMLPALQQSLPLVQSFWAGLNSIVKGLATALQSLDIGQAAAGLRLFGQAIGQLLPVAAQLLNAVMPLGNAVLGSLVPALTQLVSTAITALKPALGVIATLIEQLSPVIASLSPVFAQLGPPITQIVAALAPVIVSFVKLLAAIAPILVPIAQLAATLVSSLAPVLTTVFDALTPLMPTVINLTQVLVDVLIKAIQPLLPALITLTQAYLQVLPAIMPLIPTVLQLIEILAPLIANVIKVAAIFMTDLAPAIVAIIGWLARIAEAIAGPVVSTLQDFVRIVSTVIHDVLRFFLDLVNFLGNFFTGNWHKAWEDAKDMFKAFGTFLKDAVGGFFQIGFDIIIGIGKGIGAAFGGLLDMAKGVGGGLVKAFKDALHIFSPSQLMADEVGRYIPLGIAEGITANMGAVASAAQMASQRALTGAKVGLNLSGGFTGLNPQSAVNSGGGGTSIQNVFTGNQIMTDRDITAFANRIGGVLAKTLLPQAGVYIKG